MQTDGFWPFEKNLKFFESSVALAPYRGVKDAHTAFAAALSSLWFSTANQGSTMHTIRTSLTTRALLGTAAALTACGSMSSPAAPTLVPTAATSAKAARFR